MASMAPPKQSPRTETFVTLWPKSSSGISRMVMIFDFDCARDFTRHSPPLNRPPVEQGLVAGVAQADQLVAGDRQGILDVLLLPHPHVVGAAGIVAPEQHLVGAHHPRRIEFAARKDFALAVAAG